MVGDRQAGWHDFASLFRSFLFPSVLFFSGELEVGGGGGGWYGTDGDVGDFSFRPFLRVLRQDG